MMAERPVYGLSGAIPGRVWPRGASWLRGWFRVWPAGSVDGGRTGLPFGKRRSLSPLEPRGFRISSHWPGCCQRSWGRPPGVSGFLVVPGPCSCLAAPFLQPPDFLQRGTLAEAGNVGIFIGVASPGVGRGRYRTCGRWPRQTGPGGCGPTCTPTSGRR